MNIVTDPKTGERRELSLEEAQAWQDRRNRCLDGDHEESIDVDAVDDDANQISAHNGVENVAELKICAHCRSVYWPK